MNRTVYIMLFVCIMLTVSATCQQEIAWDGLSWPDTQPSITVLLPCPTPATGKYE